MFKVVSSPVEGNPILEGFFYSEIPERSYGPIKVAPTRPGRVGAQKTHVLPYKYLVELLFLSESTK